MEELDKRQVALLALVYARTVQYYRDLHGTRPCYAHPLSLSRLMKLCRRSGSTVAQAVRLLANTVPYGSQDLPLIVYDRISSEKNPSHRPYRIWLRNQTIDSLLQSQARKVAAEAREVRSWKTA